MKPDSNPNYVPVKTVEAGYTYKPDGCPNGGHIHCSEVTDKGYKFLRLHPSYNGETFFLTPEQFDKSNWIATGCFILTPVKPSDSLPT